MRAPKWAFLICLAAMLVPPMVQGQQAPALDRNDPAAVARAYVKACQDGDAETAISLLAPARGLAEGMRQAVRELTQDPRTGVTFAQLLIEFNCLPLRLPGQRDEVECKAQGGMAQATFRCTHAFDEQIVMAKQADGTWAIDLIASVKATTGSPKCFVEDQILGVDQAGGRAPRPRPRTTEANLSRLWGAMQEYAAEHDRRVPPADRWVDELELYVLNRQVFQSPAALDQPYGFAMYAEAGRLNLREGANGAKLVLVEVPGPQRNAVVTKEDLPGIKPVRPDGGIAYLLSTGEMSILHPDRVPWDAVLNAPPPAPPGPGRGPEEDLLSTCQDNLRVLVWAARRYAREHGGLLPKAEGWEVELQPYLPAGGGEPGGQPVKGQGFFECPAAPEIEHAYAINADLAGKNALDLTDQDALVLFFESRLDVPNAAGSPERDAADPPRHTSQPGAKRCNCVGYLGGEMGVVWPAQKAAGQ